MTRDDFMKLTVETEEHIKLKKTQPSHPNLVTEQSYASVVKPTSKVPSPISANPTAPLDDAMSLFHALLPQDSSINFTILLQEVKSALPELSHHRFQ
ncbi:hypothetical protein CDAR_301551 [Caerostris darwini]|uniref:BESS domain-containing protein n=1 Tax=Caerostris darwini TaxID=1538125 RepID=A0AAV4TSP3_9ARAC|nr:hypothetical protein CDAR_301551 [Caerostris darwini]